MNIARLIVALIACCAISIVHAQEDTATKQARLVHPISNPVFNDTAIPKTQITVIYFNHNLPNEVRTILGDLALDGNVQLVAVQVEYAFNDRLSLTAVKDGYVWFSPDSTLSDEQGFADIAAGLKYLVYDQHGLAVAVRGLVEVPIGNEDVFQGNGSGSVIPGVLATYRRGNLQLNGVAGVEIPFDRDEESTRSHVSIGAAYTVMDRLSGLVELNWFHVIDPGNGDADFGNRQLNKTVPAVITFDGPGEFNFGAAHADKDPDIVTMAVGLRLQVAEQVNLGVGVEFPLTDEESALMKNRVYLNCAITF